MFSLYKILGRKVPDTQYIDTHTAVELVYRMGLLEINIRKIPCF